MADATPKLAAARQSSQPGRSVAERSTADLMKTPEVGARFERYAPTPELGRAIHTSAILAMQAEPKLLLAPPLKLMQALFGLCRLGLEVNTPRQHAFVIPFKSRSKVDNNWIDVMLPQVVIGYRGYVHLAHASGKLVDIGGNIAVQGDDFDYSFGTKAFLRHRFGADRIEGEGTPTFGYTVISFKEGEAFDVMSWPSILRIRDRSQGFQSALAQGDNSTAYLKNPWVTDPWQMGVKTVIRRKAKTLDLSPAIDRASLMDEMGERGEADYGSLLDLDPAEWRFKGLSDEGEHHTTEQHPVKTPDADKPKAEAKKAEPAKAAAKPDATGGDPRPEPPAEGEVVKKASPTTTDERAANRAAAQAEPKAEAQQQSSPNGAGTPAAGKGAADFWA